MSRFQDGKRHCHDDKEEEEEGDLEEGEIDESSSEDETEWEEEMWEENGEQEKRDMEMVEEGTRAVVGVVGGSYLKHVLSL